VVGQHLNGTINKVDHIAYDAYGQVTSQSNSTYAPTFYYDGLWRDPASGDCKSATRWYNPALHRWITQDPDGLLPDVNPYRYCGNGPTDAVDPSGMNVNVDGSQNSTWNINSTWVPVLDGKPGAAAAQPSPSPAGPPAGQGPRAQQHLHNNYCDGAPGIVGTTANGQTAYPNGVEYVPPVRFRTPFPVPPVSPHIISREPWELKDCGDVSFLGILQTGYAFWERKVRWSDGSVTTEFTTTAASHGDNGAWWYQYPGPDSSGVADSENSHGPDPTDAPVPSPFDDRPTWRDGDDIF
jgi:RHS repeat-associated protein